jgi:hypothetical protein
MAWQELHVKKLDDLYTILNALSDTHAYVFRGHASAEWPHLVPSLHRMLGPQLNFAQTVLMEATAIRHFRRHARSLLHPSEMAYFDQILDSITLMQHYGGPTRLLDWTLSPWVACYFAVQGEADHDSAVWSFNQTELIKHNFQHRNAKGYAQFRTLESTRSVEDWAYAALHAGEYIGVFRYQYANPQMSAQQSLFTITGKLGHHHDEALESSLVHPWQRLKIIIPKTHKKALRQRLFTMNVSPLSLFPTPDGVGRSVTEAIASDVSLGDEGLLWILDEKGRGPGKKPVRRQSTKRQAK